MLPLLLVEGPVDLVVVRIRLNPQDLGYSKDEGVEIEKPHKPHSTTIPKQRGLDSMPTHGCAHKDVVSRFVHARVCVCMHVHMHV